MVAPENLDLVVQVRVLTGQFKNSEGREPKKACRSLRHAGYRICNSINTGLGEKSFPPTMRLELRER